ncbi:hypothetical protein CJF31_00000605 [Rutstroemia sp. NJR-2017a BVV2]|nr:hypothetical protein CJF31_00000605 [Rutstroemia sp. NJR-2017a BVV2]
MNSSIDLCLVPAGPSPNGHSNFHNPTSLAPALMGVLGVMVAWESCSPVLGFTQIFGIWTWPTVSING